MQTRRTPEGCPLSRALFTPSEAAEILELTEAELLELRRSRRVVAVLLNGVPLIPASEVWAALVERLDSCEVSR